ncbi:MAG TPA: hypothetical protein PLY23_09585 [Alphaproteobacteria bacterium]|nr:hypothetical protein [Alphaproteobacteria bacterium]HQS94848.1 hypothetical protein [Alphaproteobacteria bacterium]
MKSSSFKNGALSLLFTAVVGFSYPCIAESNSAQCTATAFVDVSPVQGKCAEGDILPASCPQPSENLSACSCLRPVYTVVPCLPSSETTNSSVVTPLY